MSQVRMMALEYEGPNPMGILHAALGGKTIPAISLWQPWATLWVLGEKDHETRSWWTNQRGWVAVHAAKSTKGLPICFEDHFVEAFRRHRVNWPADLPLGKIIGFVKINGCYRAEQLTRAGLVDEKEQAFGDFSPGRYAWGVSNRIALPQPIPCIGRQGFFNWNLPRDLEDLVSA